MGLDLDSVTPDTTLATLVDEYEQLAAKVPEGLKNQINCRYSSQAEPCFVTGSKALTHVAGTNWIKEAGRRGPVYPEESFTEQHLFMATLRSVNSIMEDVDSVFNCGRVRFLALPPRKCYSYHKDTEQWRLHLPIRTNTGALMVVDSVAIHMQAGHWYLLNTSKYHSAMNGDKNPEAESRLHLVFNLLGRKDGKPIAG